jgi:stearoyl-CoA 9-desaturase NADPH oxidoreductase
MAEQGAIPNVSKLRRKTMNGLRVLCTPLVADDYLELLNPLWSTRSMHGRIERIEPQTDRAATVVIRPGHSWPGHRAGQYLRIGVPINGVNHWRAYSLTSLPEGEDGCISITPQILEGGTVSPYLVREASPGQVVQLGGVEGGFVLPDPLPERLLFISAGSGITPIVSMLAELDRRGALRDVVHIHSARTEADVIFGTRLHAIDAAHHGFRLHLRLSGREGRIAPADLDLLCPDWRNRGAFASGPAAFLNGLQHFWEQEGDPTLLNLERFQPLIGEAAVQGKGGAIKFAASGVEVEGEGSTPILVSGEAAGVLLPFGCRIGVCHTCVGELQSGKVRDLRTGEIFGAPGERVRTCVNAPEGPIDISF